MGMDVESGNDEYDFMGVTMQLEVIVVLQKKSSPFSPSLLKLNKKVEPLKSELGKQLNKKNTK